MDFSHAAGGDDLVEARPRVGQHQVVEYGAGIEHGLLWNNAKAGAQFVGGKVARVDTIDQNRTQSRAVETQQQPGQCRLATTGRADESDTFARTDMKVQVFEKERSIVVVAERKIADLDDWLALTPALFR